MPDILAIDYDPRLLLKQELMNQESSVANRISCVNGGEKPKEYIKKKGMLAKKSS